MGNCFGSPIKVGDYTTHPPPNYDWKEIYDNLKIILFESYDLAYGLQQNFQTKEVPNSTISAMVKKRVAEYSMLIVMSNKEAKQRAEDTNKILERYWFKRCKKIIESVINRLKYVHVSSDQEGNLSTLVHKLQTDCLQYIEIAIHQLDKEIDEAQSTDECETERSSEERNNESDNNTTDVCKNKSSYDLETGKTIECSYDDKVEIFMLLCTCTLILKIESDNFSKIDKFIKKKN